MGAQPDAVRNTVPGLSGSPGIARRPENRTVPRRTTHPEARVAHTEAGPVPAPPTARIQAGDPAGRSQLARQHPARKLRAKASCTRGWREVS